MKNHKQKKLASFILAIMLIFTTTISTFAVEYGVEIKNAPTKTYTQKFSDVTTDHWAFKYIGEMIERGVFSGYPDGRFRPSNTITRAEFAKIMISAADITMDINDDVMYADVNSEHWARPFVNNAAIYMTGYNVQGRLEFRPESPALREDIAVALVKLKGYDISSADVSLLKAMFTDYESISQSARKYVAVAVERGLISGYEDESFRAQNSITRAEASVLLWRAYQYGSDNKVVSETTPEVLPSTKPEATKTPAPINVITPATPEPTATPTATPEPTPTPKPTSEPGTWSSHTIATIKGSIIYDMGYKNKLVYFADTKGIDFISLQGAPTSLVKFENIILNDKPIEVAKSIIGVNYNDSSDEIIFGVTTNNEFMIYSLSGYILDQLAYTNEIKGQDIDKILFLSDNTIIIVTKSGNDSTVYKVDSGEIIKLFTIDDVSIVRVDNNNKFLGLGTVDGRRGDHIIDLSGASRWKSGSDAQPKNYPKSDKYRVIDEYRIYLTDTPNSLEAVTYEEIINEDALPISFDNIKFPTFSDKDKLLVFWDSAYSKIRMFKQN